MMQTTTFTIPAMQSEAIAIQVAQALEAVPGVDRVHITLSHARAHVGFNGQLASPPVLKAAVQSAGFMVEEEAAQRSCCGGCGGG